MQTAMPLKKDIVINCGTFNLTIILGYGQLFNIKNLIFNKTCELQADLFYSQNYCTKRQLR